VKSYFKDGTCTAVYTLFIAGGTPAPLSTLPVNAAPALLAVSVGFLAQPLIACAAACAHAGATAALAINTGAYAAAFSYTAAQPSGSFIALFRLVTAGGSTNR